MSMSGEVERTSAGGVVVRTDGRGRGVPHPAYRALGLGSSQGRRRSRGDSGETALREVAEETGLVGVVEQELGSIDYSFYSREQGGRIHKTVHYFLVRATGGDTSLHDHEVSDAKWVRFARRRV